MKKLVALVLSVMLLCAAAASAMADVEISFWNGFTGSDGEILKEIVDEFNATNDKGIKINMDIIPWGNFHEKLPTAIATGTAPELVLMGNDVLLTYVNTGSLQPVDDFFAAMDFDRATVPDSVWDLFAVNGTQYMIPMQVNSLYLYWNKTLFREAGLDPEQPPKTWAELFEMAAKLTNSEKNVYGFGIPVSSTSVFENLILCNGGSFVDYETNKATLNTDVVKKSLKQIQDAIQVDKVSPLATTGADFDNILFAGQLAMYINGPWCINGCNNNGLDYSVCMIPEGDAGRSYDLGGCGYAVTTGTSDEKKAAAYEFMKFWNSTEICKKWSVVNGFPPYLQSVVEDPEVAANPLLTEMGAALQYGQPWLKGINAASTITNDVLFPMVERIMNGADVDSEVAQAQAAMDMLLAE